MSDRGSSGRPSICSGDMYGIVPSTVPSLVCAIVSSVPAPDKSATFARPKSRILMRPLRVTITLAGFRSRWTMPFSCAAASPSASSSAIVMSASTGSPSGGIFLSSDAPSTSSIVR